MLLYEMFAIGIAVVLVVAAIGGLAARVMMGPEETALSRLARAAPAQRRLVAAAAQQERDARAAAAQRRRVAAAAQQDDWIRPLAQAPIRRCTRGAALSASRHTHHSTRNTGRERLKRIEDHLCPGRARREGHRAAAVNGRAMSAWSLCDCYSITSSARASSVGGSVMPRTLAVIRLMISSTFTACWTGRSAGLSPLRMRPT